MSESDKPGEEQPENQLPEKAVDLPPQQPAEPPEDWGPGPLGDALHFRHLTFVDLHRLVDDTAPGPAITPPQPEEPSGSET
jgi:hypothetical protein